MLRIAICDDEEFICSQIENFVLNYSKSDCEDISTEIFYSGKKLCESLQNGELFDLIFLDIEMKELDGIDTGKIIRNSWDNLTTHIVFISWKDNYCKQLFEIRPTNFLQKPISQNQIIKEIKYVQNQKSKNNQAFIFKVGHETLKIPFSNIISFESQNKTIIITTIRGNYRFYDTIDKVFSIVGSYGFIRIHKSYIVNYLHVVKFKYDEVEMINSKKMPISQSRRKEVRAIQVAFEKEDMANGIV